MKLRSGTVYGSVSGNGTAASEPIRSYSEMSDVLRPLLESVSGITGEDRVLRKLPAILRTFQTFNQCDLAHMMKHADWFTAGNVASLTLMVLYKSCALAHEIVDHLRGRDCKDMDKEDKRNVILVLTELCRAKLNLVEVVRGWMGRDEMVVRTALTKACNGENQRIAYKGVLNRWFYEGYPPTSMDAEENDGYAEEKVFDHCFVDPAMRGMVADTMCEIYTLRDENEVLRQRFGRMRD
jgi:hypothetical protein